MSGNRCSTREKLVSIVMNCHNGAAYLEEAISSVVNQSHDHWELIFWDNFSSDNSLKTISSYKDSRIKIFRAEVFQSLGNARNNAVKECGGAFICFLDTDDVWESSKLKNQIKYFEQNPSCGLLYANFILIPQDQYKIKNFFNAFKKTHKNQMQFSRLFRSNFINLQTVMLRAEILNDLDYIFDPFLELSEEYDLFLRLAYKNKIGHLNKTLASYRVHSQMSSLKNIERYQLENTAILNNLENSFSDFPDRYCSEIKLFQAKTAYYQCRTMMRNNDRKAATEKMSDYKLLNVRFFLIYLLVLLGPKMWKIIHKTFGRYV